MNQLNVIERRALPCPKPTRKRKMSPGTSTLEEPSTGTEALSSPGAFLTSNCAYLSAITPTQMDDLRNGKVTVIDRPCDDYWKNRANIGNSEGMPKSASVMVLSTEESSEKSEQYAVTSCVVVDNILKFTLDPTKPIEESGDLTSDGSRVIQSQSSDSCPEGIAKMVHDAHCALESVKANDSDMSTEQAATLKGIVGLINSLLVSRSWPQLETTPPRDRDVLFEVIKFEVIKFLCLSSRCT